MTTAPSVMPAPPRNRALRRLALVILMVGATLAAAMQPASATTIGYGASYYHPFSNPVWYPLRTAASMGCDMGNPSVNDGNSANCRTPLQHTVWSMDLISASRSATDPREPVFPMGAGVLHYGATGQGCGGIASRGNYVYIDHGNGVLSYYGHLGTIYAADGEYVSPRTPIATIGHSGYSGCRTYPYLRYLYLAVKHGGTNGIYWNVQHMYTCVGGLRTTWPDTLSNNPASTGHWTVWNDVPSRIALQSPDPTRACIQTPVPTPSAPVNARMYRTSTGVATAYWSPPYVSQSVTWGIVQFQEYHPTIHLWLDLVVRPVLSTSTYTRFYGLTTNRYYRMRISWANNTGLSRTSYYHEIRSL